MLTDYELTNRIVNNYVKRHRFEDDAPPKSPATPRSTVGIKNGVENGSLANGFEAVRPGIQSLALSYCLRDMQNVALLTNFLSLPLRTFRRYGYC